MSNSFTTYTFVCDPNQCDALLEFTARDGFGFPNGEVSMICPCGRQMSYISASIKETNQQEGAPAMETMEYLHTEIAKKDERIRQLEEHTQRITERDYKTAGELQGLRDGMHEWTMNALEQREISETNAEEIAEICGFELFKEVEAEVTVTYSMTVQVPAGEDVESIINDVDFESINYDTDKISYVSASIDSVDF